VRDHIPHKSTLYALTFLFLLSRELFSCKLDWFLVITSVFLVWFLLEGSENYLVICIIDKVDVKFDLV